METVKVSRKYQVVIPEKLRREANIKPGDKMVALTKHGILQYVPLRSLRETKGMAKGLDSVDLRDETDRSWNRRQLWLDPVIQSGPKTAPFQALLRPIPPK